MFTHFLETSSRFTHADKAKGVKRLLFAQDFERKYQYLTLNPSKQIQMEVKGKILVDFRGGLHQAKTSLFTAFSPIPGISETYHMLNNVKCVKNVLFENYFEQFYHFSTV